jgi:cytochrome c peroxidase
MGLYYRTRKPADIGKFRTPSLRELKYTAPYMHNGSLADLRQVIDFYDQGGGVEHKTDLLQPLALSSDEKLALLAFLESLSMDEPLLVTPPSLPEYQAMQ